MALTLRNVAINGVYYAVTLGALPYAALWLEARWWGLATPSGFVRSVGIVLGLAGVFLQVSSIVLLQTRGRGTPSPIAPPVRFVWTGPYAWVRNPINFGELLLFLGMAVWFASWVLVCYAAVAWISFQIFVIAWEEPRHRRLYGSEFASYCGRVSRWFPRWPTDPDQASKLIRLLS